jgi:hypothetical protein
MVMDLPIMRVSSSYGKTNEATTFIAYIKLYTKRISYSQWESITSTSRRTFLARMLRIDTTLMVERVDIICTDDGIILGEPKFFYT